MNQCNEEEESCLLNAFPRAVERVLLATDAGNDTDEHAGRG